ncbi:MAG: hypothetical protein KF861_02010 [Planctomycetaceae bacterium]|nr:hypothetical protein [Planctomycetaceae bacterium]
MKRFRFDRDQPLNLDASASQELKRVIVGKQTEDDPASSHVIPDVRSHAIRPQTACREFLRQPFGDMRM